MQLPPAFFLPDGDRLIATEATRGPWSREHQHGGPPAALLTREIERRSAAAEAPLHLARIAVEFRRPIPIEPLRVRAETARAGKKVQVVDAFLEGASGLLARASAVLIRREETAAASEEAAATRRADGAEGPALPDPEASAPYEFPFFAEVLGYQKAMETRVARGAFGRGAMAVWFRARLPLVAGEEASPSQRVVLAADSNNGVSVALDLRRWTFLNPDLTVALLRPPVGEWVCLDGVTFPGAEGAGLAEARLHDARGVLGRSLQTLVIERRAQT